MASYTSSAIEWKFARHGKFDSQKGGVSNFAFNLDIDTFVREVVQNVNDQRLSAEKPAEAKFIVEDLSGTRLISLLELIGWDVGLRDHLNGVANGTSHQKEMASRALKAVKSGAVRVLTIVDSGTNGLTGGETSKIGNFAMLCRHELVTDSDAKAVRGGSFGIGKSVLWAFSSASAVLFNSKPKNNPDDKAVERFIGRAYLPTHDVAIGHSVQTFKQDGWFGYGIEEEGDSGTVSIKDGHAADHVGDSSLSRKGLGTGTSILVPFFENPTDNEEQTLEELATQIRESIAKWFWPAIDKQALKASVVVRKSGKDREDQVVLPHWISYFLRAANSQENIQLITEEVNAGRTKFNISMPERVVDEKHSNFDGELELCLTRLSDIESDYLEKEDLVNTVAFIRGALMVVQYSNSLSNSFPDFVGVLRVGRANSESSEDNKVDTFFRDAEPPAHDKWIPTAKIKSNYKGTQGTKTLGEFKTAMSEVAKKLLGVTSVGGEKIPKKLAELLAGRRKGHDRKKRTETFHTKIEKIEWAADGEVSARATLKRMKGTKPWTVKVGLILSNETGGKVELDHTIESIKVTPNNLVKAMLAEKSNKDLAERWTPGFRVYVPEGVTEIGVALSARTTRLGKETVRRSRANLLVSFNSKDDIPDA